MSESKPKMPSAAPSASKPGWTQIVLPLLAALVHLRVFHRAARSCIYEALVGASANYSTEEFLHQVYSMDYAVFVAYVFDLACCALGAIPFSRCDSARDIVGHHLPTLLLALPLAVPLWAGYANLEPRAYSILDLEVGDALRGRYVEAWLLASGFAYISSLNEVIMCLQRAEMSWQGCARLRDISKMRVNVFTSRLAMFVELAYKLSFFWGMAWMGCWACCQVDRTLWQHLSTTDAGASWARKVAGVYSSPGALRAVLFRVFSVVMYPSMGARCLKKIKQLHGGGKAVKSA